MDIQQYVACFFCALICGLVHISIISVTGHTCNNGQLYTDNSTCFWLITSKQDFNDSQQKCAVDGGSLALIPDPLMLDFLNLLRKDAGFQYEEFYIGYKVNDTSHLIRLDGVVQSWAPWRTGQPSSGKCVSTFNTPGTFWSEYCTDSYYAICQWPNYTWLSNTVTTTTSAPDFITSDETTVETTPSTEAINVFTTTYAATSAAVTPSPNTNTATNTSCTCQPIAEVQSNLTAKEKEEIAENISRLLSVDKKTLSSTIRSKTSASDDRPSATGVGSVGAVLLVLVFGGIVMLDAPVFLKYAKSLHKFVRQYWPKTPHFKKTSL